MRARDDLTISLGHLTVPLEIRRRKGTRHMRLSYGHRNQVVVSVPMRCSDREALRFVEKQHAWLLAQSAKMPRVRTVREWLEMHPQMSGSGDVFLVRIERVSDRARADYIFENGGSELVLRIPASAADCDATLLQLVKRFAKDALACRVAFHAKRLGLNYGKLSVRDQSSRWGSCSSTGGISLNWRLILLDPVLQDYVILHELAHLTEMNHSRRFWGLLDQYDPDRLANEAKLNELTVEVMRVGRGD